MMNRVSKIVYTLLVLFSLSILDSCTYVKKADSAVRKTFGTANRFKRQKSLYTRRLGLDNKKGADNPDGEDQMQRNPIQQKNIINDILLLNRISLHLIFTIRIIRSFFVVQA